MAAQEPQTLGALRTPPSPAFTVLGIEPSAVERPTTPSDVALTFLGRLRRETVPKDYAFEASPYWLVGRPTLSWRDDASRSVAESVARTTGFSVATAETGTTALPVASLAIGARTLLASGGMNAATVRALETLETVLGQDSELFLKLMFDHGLQALDDMLKNGQLPVAEYNARRQELVEIVLASDEYRNNSALRTAQSVAVTREGFLFELAAGLVWDFAGASWEARRFRRRAVWATPGYEAGPWNVLGVLRYIDDSVTPNEDAVDWGGRAIFSTPDYALSLEFVERSPIDPTPAVKRSHRFVGVAEYRVSPATWVVASFGKDRKKAGTADTLVAQIGLSFSFSKDRYTF